MNGDCTQAVSLYGSCIVHYSAQKVFGVWLVVKRKPIQVEHMKKTSK
jgi:hypothetical protein